MIQTNSFRFAVLAGRAGKYPILSIKKDFLNDLLFMDKVASVLHSPAVREWG